MYLYYQTYPLRRTVDWVYDGRVNWNDKVRRGSEPDTTWSDPGSTFGIPDRWQWRNYKGLRLVVGNNHRLGPTYTKFVIPAERTPWKVYAYKPNDKASGQLDLFLVARGEAGSQELAREAAENVAKPMVV